MIITSPQQYHGASTTLFLAGGINCWDWQSPVAELLNTRTDLVLFNPRRTNWNINDSEEESKKQIAWEHDALKRSNAILFWFPEETLCPITLLELGKYMMTSKPLFVGTHRGYQRRLDVIEQLRHERPEVQVVDSWIDLVDQVVDWYVNPT